MVYIITFFLSFAFCVISEKMYEKGKRWSASLFAVLAIFVVSFLAGVRDFTIGTDIETYGHWLFKFAQSHHSIIGFVKSNTSIDVLYMVFVYIIAHLFVDEHWLYFFTGLFIYGYSFWGFMKLKKYCNVSWVWLCYLFLLYGDTLNAMRQCMALALFIWSFSYLIQEKYMKYIIITLIASLFHSTALVSLAVCLIYLLLKKNNTFQIKAIILLLTLSVLVLYGKFAELLIHIGIISEKYERYILDGSMLLSLNPMLIRIPFLLIILVFYKSFCGKFDLNQESENKNTNFYLYDFFLIMMFIEVMVSQMRNVHATLYRLSFYFCIFRCMSLGRVVFELRGDTRRVIKVVLMVMLIGIFIYQTIIRGNNSVYPYTSSILGI